MEKEELAGRSRIGHAEKRGDPEAIATARQEFKAIRASVYIRKLVEEAPPLNQEQLDRLAAILRGRK